MRQSPSLLFLASLCAIAIGAYLIGVHGSDWIRTARTYWAAAPDFPGITARAGGPLVLISTSTCPWCAKSRRWLQQQGRPYQDCVLDQLPGRDAVLAAVGSSAVPQLITPHGRVIGYDVDAYANLTATSAAIPGGTLKPDEQWSCIEMGRTPDVAGS